MSWGGGGFDEGGRPGDRRGGQEIREGPGDRTTTTFHNCHSVCIGSSHVCSASVGDALRQRLNIFLCFQWWALSQRICSAVAAPALFPWLVCQMGRTDASGLAGRWLAAGWLASWLAGWLTDRQRD